MNPEQTSATETPDATAPRSRLHLAATVALWVVAAACLFLCATKHAPYFRGLIRLTCGLQKASNDIERERFRSELGASGRCLDYALPPETRVFVGGQLGETNSAKLGQYYHLLYHLYPRQVDISLEQPARYVSGPPPKRTIYYAGQAPPSPQAVLDHGYQALVQFDGDNIQLIKSKSLTELDPTKRQLCPSVPDVVTAFFLPLLVALVGAQLLRWLFPQLHGELGWGEKAAASLGLGVLVVTQFDFALRCLGLRLELWFWIGGILWAAYRLVRRLQASAENGRAPWRPQREHLVLLGLLPVAVLFAAWFRAAGQLGLMEFDAVANWAFKAKLIFYNSGGALIKSFSNPAWGHAHLDYPVLVPMLHALTYGALDHVNEFVTKFWMVWLLAFLLAGVLSACGWPRQNRALGLGAACAIAFLPMSVRYVLWEGAGIPLFFFVMLGSLHLAIALREGHRARLGLGLVLLAGAALCKFEGMILFGLWLAALLAWPAARALLGLDRHWARVAGLILACWLPYALFRSQIPALHPESAWAQMLWAHPGQVLANFPKELFALLARQFFHEDFAHWTSPDSTHLVWAGQWRGLLSVLPEPSCGCIWLALLLSMLLFRQRPALRAPVLLFALVTFAFIGALCLVTSSLPQTLEDLPALLNFTSVSTGGRYAAPVICAWAISLVGVVARDRAPAPA